MLGYVRRERPTPRIGEDEEKQIAHEKLDYRATLNDLHLAYVRAWVDWCHRNGWLARNQGHGAPANLLDLYAAVDIPETETFGSRIFPITGYRRDARDVGKDELLPIMASFASP